MKQLLYTSLLLFGIVFISSCEDVIEVDVPSEEPRLIVNALIRVDTSLPFMDVKITVAETSSFFGTVPPTGLQQISITSLGPEGGGPILLETEPGVYVKEAVGTDFLMSGPMVLQIDFEDKIFLAFSEFQPTSAIESLAQGDGTVFDEDDTEIIVSFTDNGEQNNYYVFEFGESNFLETNDEFYQGQSFEFSYFFEDELNPGDEVPVSIMGVDESFHDYMALLIEQSDRDFGVFETPAVTVRGNIINATDIDNIENFNNVNMSDNFALGYFAIVQEFKDTLTIQ
ncbi:MAG: DUF4249 domain-containing protein [Flavobacteriaceae bacterium]|nr:DUF4249 domain-containing protein [Flavobacteriaceae bacterium]